MHLLCLPVGSAFWRHLYNKALLVQPGYLGWVASLVLALGESFLNQVRNVCSTLRVITW